MITRLRGIRRQTHRNVIGSYMLLTNSGPKIHEYVWVVFTLRQLPQLYFTFRLE